MGNFALVLPFFCLFLLSANPGGIVKMTANGQEAGLATWCVAKTTLPDENNLQANIQYVCDTSGIDCSIIQPGGACYYPNTVPNHASVVMNLYFQISGRHSWNCDFRNTGLITLTDPSYAGCKYAFGE